jgi:hypothetical protein
MEGKVTLSAAKEAENYLKKSTHPVIANRMLRLAELSGFDLADDVIIGIDNVKIEHLQAALIGFKLGLELQ